MSPAEQWRLYFKRRRPTASLAEILGARKTPLAWSAHDGEGASAFVELLEALQQVEARQQGGPKKRSRGLVEREAAAQLLEWIASDPAPGKTSEFAASCLAAAHLLAAVGSHIDPDAGWRVADYLWQSASDADAWSTDPHAGPDEVLAQQMLAGELPLTLSFLFPDMAPMHALRRTARRRLGEGLFELLNGDGLVRGAHLSAMRSLLACWTRCAAMGRSWNKGPWPPGIHNEFRHAVQQAIRWTSPTGSQLRGGSDGPWPADLLDAALRFGGDASSSAAAARWLPSSLASGRRRSRPAARKLPASSDSSDWSELAVLRTDWSPSAVTLAVDHSRAEMGLEIWNAARRVVDGFWRVRSTADDEALEPTGPWDAVCWLSDEDVDYLELCLPLTGDARLERQIMLGRRDAFLFLCDHVQCRNPAVLTHDLVLPLGVDVAAADNVETRDVILRSGKRIMRVMPLALPEWRADPRGGELTCNDGRLVLRRHGSGRALACPLFIDFDARRARKESTWRQLTVAESLQIVAPDVAVSYRIQCGRDQWVCYRSQGPRGNRTFLGQNISSEFLAARFLAKQGGLKELIEVEG